MIQITLNLWCARGTHFSVQFLAALNEVFFPSRTRLWNISPSVTKKQIYLFLRLLHLDTVTSTLDSYNLERPNHIHCLKAASNKTPRALDQQWATQEHLQPQKSTSALFSEKLRSQTLLAEGPFTQIISFKLWSMNPPLYLFGHRLNGNPFLQTAKFLFPSMGTCGQRLAGWNQQLALRFHSWILNTLLWIFCFVIHPPVWECKLQDTRRHCIKITRMEPSNNWMSIFSFCNLFNLKTPQHCTSTCFKSGRSPAHK